MAINTYNLQAVKKELQHLSAVQMAELCLRLAKYKKDNKELLSYLLFEAGHSDGYVQGIKEEVQLLFSHLPAHYYYANKTARKILTLINKHVKFIASKTAEIDLLINYCHNYLIYVDKRTNYKPLRQVIVRQLERIGKLIASLHEDLQFDHQSGFEKLISEADEKLSWVNKHDFL